jgi:hypothetical protein
MKYKADFRNKFIEKIGFNESREIKRKRFDTYFSYLTYRTTIANSTKKSVINVCNSRLQDMENSDYFDKEFIEYLNTKKLDELQYK